MGTKNNPGQFDCYTAAHPDEPMFVLLGRDHSAPSLVEAWANTREQRGVDPNKIAEARGCANMMRAWLISLGKKEEPVAGGWIDVRERLPDDLPLPWSPEKHLVLALLDNKRHEIVGVRELRDRTNEARIHGWALIWVRWMPLPKV